MEILDVVDEQGNIVGQDTHKNIHKMGLLHKEIHVWFYTPKGEIVFQHRAKDKDTFPNLLDATVGGHVEIGDDFGKTALKEMKEETGVIATKNNLRLIKTVRSNRHDLLTNKKNNTIRYVFAYKFTGKFSDLKIEQGEATGFELWSIEKLENVNSEDAKRFISTLLDKEHVEMYKSFLKL